MRFSLLFAILYMTENKITFAISANQTKKGPAQVEGMIALKKIENYSYALTDEIGLGFSSHVYRGRNDHNNETVAIKVIDLRKEDELSRQFVNEEIAVLESVRSKGAVHLLRLYDVFKTKNNLYIITEFCEGKDVAKLLRKRKRFSETEAQSILKQLLMGYRDLWELGIVHRDLKLANVFVRRGQVKLADFGFAIPADRCLEKFDYNVGSPYYMPPESLKFNRYSGKSDVWSLGIIAYEMVFGRLPWKEKVETVLYDKIMATPLEELLDADTPLSENYRHFLFACLQVDFERRATPEQLFGFQWPMAVDYVEGVEPDQGYKPVTTAKIPQQQNNSKHFVTAHTIEEDRNERNQRHFRMQHQISLPQTQNQVRDRSPPPRPERKPSAPMEEYREWDDLSNPTPQMTPLPPTPPPAPLNYNNNDPETSILGQLHFCRFMSYLWEQLADCSLPQAPHLRQQLSARIFGKLDVLLHLSENDNPWSLDSLPQYLSSERGGRLRETIQRYDRSLRDLIIETRAEGSEQVLVTAIRQLRGNLPGSYWLLEDLVYFYQLRELERRSSVGAFAAGSKVELLGRRRREGAVATGLPERMLQRLQLLGL